MMQRVTTRNESLMQIRLYRSPEALPQTYTGCRVEMREGRLLVFQDAEAWHAVSSLPLTPMDHLVIDREDLNG